MAEAGEYLISNWLADGLIFLAGMAIGATSIGGVAVVPVLSGIAGVPLPQAIAATSFAFLPTGVLGWYSARRQALLPNIPWALHVSALLGALTGAMVIRAVPPDAARVGLTLLTAGSGIYGLISVSAASSRSMPPTATQAALGFAVGCGSALSGTGGPVLLLPLLMLWRAPTGPSVAAAMSIQLPVAVAASATHWLAGTLPLVLGLRISVIVLVGAWVGRALSRRLPVRVLRVGTSLSLIAVGAWYGLSS